MEAQKAEGLGLSRRRPRPLVSRSLSCPGGHCVTNSPGQAWRVWVDRGVVTAAVAGQGGLATSVEGLASRGPRALLRELCDGSRPLTDGPFGRPAEPSTSHAMALRLEAQHTSPAAGFSGSSVSEPIKYTCSQNCILSVCLLTLAPWAGPLPLLGPGEG